MRRAGKNVLRAFCLAVLTLAVGCARHSLPPSSLIDGWQYAGRPDSYDRQTLFNHINGKARVYLDYGFLRLDHVQFAPLPGKPVIDVHLYDMGSPTGAFGIYSLERGEELPLHHRRRLGYMIGSSRFFWKGRHYVTITSADSSPETVEAINALSLYLESTVRGDTEGIPVLAAFPTEDKVPESEQYFAVSLLGHEFMGGGFTVAYQEKGNRFKLFAAPKESRQAAAEAYLKLKSALFRQGKLLEEVTGVGQLAFEAQETYLGNWLVSLAGNCVVAAVGFQDEALARGLLTQLTLNLRPLIPPPPAKAPARPAATAGQRRPGGIRAPGATSPSSRGFPPRRPQR